MRVIGIGAGGHAKMVLEALQSQSGPEVVGLLDSNPDLKRMSILGVPVLGGDELLGELVKDGVTHAFLGVGGVGDNAMRRRLFDSARARGIEFVTVIHRSAVVSPSAVIGEGTVVLPRAVVGAGARLGRNVIVNTGAIVEHDCDLGDHVHVASGAVLAGGVVAGEGAHIGAGATVKQGVRVGRGAVVGLGAAVIDDVPDATVVGGVPARPIATGLTT